MNPVPLQNPIKWTNHENLETTRLYKQIDHLCSNGKKLKIDNSEFFCSTNIQECQNLEEALNLLQIKNIAIDRTIFMNLLIANPKNGTPLETKILLAIGQKYDFISYGERIERLYWQGKFIDDDHKAEKLLAAIQKCQNLETAILILESSDVTIEAWMLHELIIHAAKNNQYLIAKELFQIGKNFKLNTHDIYFTMICYAQQFDTQEYLQALIVEARNIYL